MPTGAWCLRQWQISDRQLTAFLDTQGPDGVIKITVLPPLPEGEDYDPAAVNAAMGWPPAR